MKNVSPTLMMNKTVTYIEISVKKQTGALRRLLFLLDELDPGSKMRDEVVKTLEERCDCMYVYKGYRAYDENDTEFNSLPEFYCEKCGKGYDYEEVSKMLRYTGG